MKTKLLIFSNFCYLAIKAVEQNSEENTLQSNQYEIKNIDKLSFGYVLVATSFSALKLDTATNYYDIVFRILVATNELQPKLVPDTKNANKIKIKFFNAAQFTLSISEATKGILYKGNSGIDLSLEEVMNEILKQKVKKGSVTVEDIESDELDKVVTINNSSQNGVGSDKPWVNVPLWTVTLEISGINWKQENLGYGAPLVGDSYTFKIRNNEYSVVTTPMNQIQRIYNEFAKVNVEEIPWYKGTAAIVIYSVIGGLLFLLVVFVLVCGTRGDDK